MNTAHARKPITSSDIDDGWVISAYQICKIGDNPDIRMLRYGDCTCLEHVLGGSKSLWSPIRTSVSAVYSNYNHTLYIHINSLRTIGQWSWIIVKSNTVSTFGVPPWLCLLEYCVLKLSCQSWQSITHSRNYIIVTYRLRNCNSWEFRMIIIYIQNPLYVQTSSASRPRGLNLVWLKRES